MGTGLKGFSDSLSSIGTRHSDEILLLASSFIIDYDDYRVEINEDVIEYDDNLWSEWKGFDNALAVLLYIQSSKEWLNV